MVFEVIIGVVNDNELLCNNVPAVAAEYQSIVCPAETVPPIVIREPVQPVPAIATGTAGKALMVAKTGVLVIDAHPVEVVFASI